MERERCPRAAVVEKMRARGKEITRARMLCEGITEEEFNE